MKTIKEFIEFLEKFSRDNCPDEYYQAWKILVLKTDEYRTIYNSEFAILHHAFEKWKTNY